MANPVNITQQVDLKTLRLAELSTIIEDINYNFSILRSHPMFQGIKGEQGTPGIKGTPGTRGSRWLFFYKNEFQAIFPSTNFSTFTTERYISWINAQLQNQVTRPLILQTLSISEFVDTDIVVLPNTAMIQYSSVSQSFENTNVQINSESGYVRKDDLDKAIEDVKKLINADLEQIGIPSYLKSFISGVDSPNTLSNDFSYLDPVAGDGITEPYVKHRWFGPNSDDADIAKANIMTLLAGLKEWYHEVIQYTLAGNNFSSKFVPNPDRMPAFVVLQNDQNSGILIGPKPGDTPETKVGIDKFGSIFMGPGISIDRVTKKVTKDISKYGLHLTSNINGSATSSTPRAEVFVTPATIYLIASLVEVMEDFLVHGKSTFEGKATFNEVVEILKTLDVDKSISTPLINATDGNFDSVNAKNLKLTNVQNLSSKKFLVIQDDGSVSWVNINSGGSIDYGATESWNALTPVDFSNIQKPSFTGKIPSASNLNTITNWMQRVYSYIIDRCSKIETKNVQQDQVIVKLQTNLAAANKKITDLETALNNLKTTVDTLSKDSSNFVKLKGQTNQTIDGTLTAKDFIAK